MRTVSIVVAALVVPLGFAACKKSPEPIVREGWVQDEGWRGSCYFPRDFAAMGPGDRRMYRQEVLEQLMTQWRGERDDGVSFDEKLVEQVETALLGEPVEIEAAAARNAALCETAMKGGGTSEWERYLDELPEKLAEGECHTPLVDRYFNYIDINRDWQNRVGICEGNTVQVKASSLDLYRIHDKGPWITVDGDPAQSAIGKELPCNTEGCFAGQLILRFVGESHVERIVPIGANGTFTAPGHGYIEIMINDTTFYDNKYKVESGLEHHASIEYAPQ